MMNLIPDRWQHALRHPAAAVGERILPYGIYSLREEEHIGTLDTSLVDARELIREYGYHYNVVAASKLHPDDGKEDHGSYRRIHPEDRDVQWHCHCSTEMVISR